MNQFRRNHLLIDAATHSHARCVHGQIAATVQAFVPFDFVALEGTVAAIPSWALCRVCIFSLQALAASHSIALSCVDAVLTCSLNALLMVSANGLRQPCRHPDRLPSSCWSWRHGCRHLSLHCSRAASMSTQRTCQSVWCLALAGSVMCSQLHAYSRCYLALFKLRSIWQPVANPFHPRYKSTFIYHNVYMCVVRVSLTSHGFDLV